jgi:Secretion system C-terminal sorting domain
MKCFILLAILFLSLFSKGQTTFNKRFNFGFPAAVLTSIVVTDSCYYSTGVIADSMPPFRAGNIFVKFDIDGNQVFNKTVTSAEKTYETWYKNLTILSDGTLSVAGQSRDSLMRAILFRYDSNGDTINTITFTNPFYPQYDFIRARAMAPYPDDGYIFICQIGTPPNGIYKNSDIYVVRTSDDGSIVWSKILGNTLWEVPESVIIDSGKNIIFGAKRYSTNLVVENYTWQTWITQLDSVGNIQWQYLSPIDSGLRDAANDMMLSDDGSLVVASGAGTEIDHPSVNVVYFDKYVFKLNPDGEIEWELTFPDSALTSWSTTTKILKLTDGSGYLLAGMAYNALPPPKYFIVSGWLSKITPDGDSIWTRKFAFLNDGQDEHKIYDLKETPDGGFILCGEARDWSGTDSIPQQAWLLKLDEYGCLVPGCYTATEEPAGGEPAISLAIYPNPASDYLNFYLRTSHPAREASFRIVNAEGRLMKTFQIDRPDATYIVPVWDWAAGVYILQYVEEGVVRVSEKFIVSSL